MATIIDGKALSAKIKEDIRVRALEFESKFGRKVGLAVIKVGNNPASEVYVRNKILACEATGIKSFSYNLPESALEEDVLALVEELNNQDGVDGIRVQNQIDSKKVLEAISPEKDADGFHVINAGSLMVGLPCTVACTPAGIIELIKSTGESIEGKHAVVIGRSNIVGKPVAMLLLAENATVTICHSRTKNLPEIVKQADILVAAVGIKEFVRGNWVKESAIVIDVGMNRSEGKLYGDVAFDEVEKVASFITPVPGGVGPMTVTMLLDNTVKAAIRRCKEN